MRVVHFPDGTVVRAGGLSDSRRAGDWSKFGLYLHPEWSPPWPHEKIDWPDFGVPDDAALAARQIRAAFERAKAGRHVEVGCKGGLGRTGTVLACMAMLAGVDPAQAVAWVRKHYDPCAVETQEQEEWVLWFAKDTWQKASQSEG